MIGVNMATILGVPLGTAIGNASGWRTTPVGHCRGRRARRRSAVPSSSSPTPAGEQRPVSDFSAELAAALRLPVLLCYASIAFSLLAFFVMVAYIVPLLTVGGGLPLDIVPLALLGIGFTGFFGNLVGGRLGDWNRSPPCSASSPSTPCSLSSSAQVASTGWAAVGRDARPLVRRLRLSGPGADPHHARGRRCAELCRER